ncbi:hypothetical protein QE152_g4282 [Popillia japonica]|uniref:Uncharacterized protein n=1 Tax=Popillia japonica TaxID=7064 RepID=A0AAW1N2Z0_POPJA
MVGSLEGTASGLEFVYFVAALLCLVLAECSLHLRSVADFVLIVDFLLAAILGNLLDIAHFEVGSMRFVVDLEYFESDVFYQKCHHPQVARCLALMDV